jgi:hypothetical protein
MHAWLPVLIEKAPQASHSPSLQVTSICLHTQEIMYLRWAVQGQQ